MFSLLNLRDRFLYALLFFMVAGFCTLIFSGPPVRLVSNPHCPFRLGDRHFQLDDVCRFARKAGVKELYKRVRGT